MTAQLRKCLDTEKKEFKKRNGRDMTAEDVPFSPSFASGHVAMDEPPGLEERYYQLWLDLGGTVNPPRVVTADDL